MGTRRELITAVGHRYRNASRTDRTAILDEFVALTGYHRKHAIRVLTGVPHESRQETVRNRLYDEGVRQALIVCGKPPIACAASASRH
jgi:hypothetical protein